MSKLNLTILWLTLNKPLRLRSSSPGSCVVSMVNTSERGLMEKRIKVGPSLDARGPAALLLTRLHTAAQGGSVRRQGANIYSLCVHTKRMINPPHPPNAMQLKEEEEASVHKKPFLLTSICRHRRKVAQSTRLQPKSSIA